MQDRVPLYPGRVKLNPVAGQDNTFDMVRADEPTQPGTPLNKATLLKDYTANLLGLPNTAVPDDAFLALLIGVGTYGYRVKIQLEDGTPVEGSTVSGIQALTGSTLVSGPDGIVLGKSTSNSVTISCTSPYIDHRPSNNQVVTSTGTITDVTIVLDHAVGIVKITSSIVAKISHLSKTVDITAVGGGGGGGATALKSDTQYYGGGGGGGNSEHALGVDIVKRSLEISIGSGGVGTRVNTGSTTLEKELGSPGGTTNVKFQNTLAAIVSASGGELGHDVLHHGNNDGGASRNGGNGSKGGNNAGGMNEPRNGSDCKEHIFGDPTLSLVGCGGGGGGVNNSSVNSAGGELCGGKGGAGRQGENGKSIGGGGGGGGRSNSSGFGGNGGAGGVYLRFHF